MSKISLIIKEAKIINSKYNKPERWLNDKTDAFKCLSFDICPTISRKDAKGEWETKLLSIRCTIWNENLAEKFLWSFDKASKNYITILDGTLTNFHTDIVKKISNAGNEYNVNVYSYLAMTVNDFVMTSKPLEDNGNKEATIEHDAKSATSSINEEESSPIPF